MQVPNRYYNSPWIADAARNLSMAIYGDPEQEARRERMNFEMQRAQAADAQAQADRARQQEARNALGAILTTPEADVSGALSAAIALGADPNAAFTAAGTQSPKFQQQSALQGEKLSAGMRDLEKRLAVQEAIAQMASGDRRYAADTGAATADANRASRERIAQANNIARTTIANLRGPGGTPLDISPTDMQNLSLNIAMVADGFGGQLDPATLQQITARAAALYQTNRNAGAAVNAAFTEAMGDQPTVVPGQNNWFSPDVPTRLAPNPAAQPAPAPSSLGAIVAPPGIPPLLARPAPTTPQRPPLAAFQR